MSSIVEGIRRLRTQSSGSEATALPFPKPIKPDEVGERTCLWSNVFHVDMPDSDVTLSQYDVDIWLSREDFDVQAAGDPTRVLALTRTPFEGARAIQSSEICGKVMHQIMNCEDVITWNKVFYDHHRVMYVAERIDTDGKVDCSVKLDDNDIIYCPYKYAKASLNYKGDVVISRKNLKNITDVFSNKKIINFVEIVASKFCRDQIIADSGLFCQLSGNRIYFTKDSHALAEGKELLDGLRKTVDFIEGPSGRGGLTIGITMDATKLCVLKHCILIDAAETICQKKLNSPCSDADLERLNRVLKGVVVVARYSNIHMNMKIERIVKDTAKTAKFMDDKNKCWTIYDYFKEAKGETLKFPDAPLAEITRGGKKLRFPLEFMGILPGNMVPNEKQTAEIMAEVVKSSAMLPQARMMAIMKASKAQEVFASCEGANCTIDSSPIKVDARILTAPDIVYSLGKHSGKLDDRGSWKRPVNGRFLKGGEPIKKWAFFVIGERNAVRFDIQVFVGRFLHQCRLKGLQAPEFAECGFVSAHDLEKLFGHLSTQNFDFILFATDNRLKTQDEIKYYERKYKVATQNMKLSTVQSIVEQGRAATLENLIQKLNCKLGGLNHLPERPAMQFTKSFKNGEIFVLGIGDVLNLKNTSVEIEGKLPFVLSYAGNFGLDPSALIGDFSIENMSHADVKVLGAELFTKAFDALSEASQAGKRKIPENFVIYRTGTTDSDMKTIMAKEIPAIRDYLNKRVGEHRLLYLMAHTNHANRFFRTDLNPNAKAPEQNIRPGTVIDSCVTHPHLRQFYVNAHVALQGTAKCPRYTVLWDDTNADMGYLETMTFDLCFMHQIVNLPTALPSPLRVAEEYGKRGKRILLQYLSENGGAFNDAVVKKCLEYKYAVEFKNRRINA